MEGQQKQKRTFLWKYSFIQEERCVSDVYISDIVVNQVLRQRYGIHKRENQKYVVYIVVNNILGHHTLVQIQPCIYKVAYTRFLV